MQDPLSVFCRIAERMQDLEKSLHIFCQIHVLPVAGIEVPRILYTEDRIGKVRGFRGVGGIHIGVGTCHNNGTRRYYMFSDLNADRLKIDLRLHISCDEESVLNRPDGVSGAAGDKGLILCLYNIDRRSGPDPFCEFAVSVHDENELFLLDQVII